MILNRKNNYKLITDEDTLKSWIKNIEATGIVSIDTETTSLDATSAKLVGVSLAINAGKAVYIPINHQSKEGPITAKKINQLDEKLVLSLLKPVMEDPSIIKIGQNMESK